MEENKVIIGDAQTVGSKLTEELFASKKAQEKMIQLYKAYFESAEYRINGDKEKLVDSIFHIGLAAVELLDVIAIAAEEDLANKEDAE